MFKPTDKPKRYLAAAAFAAVLITVPCLGALNTSADQARMEWPAPEHFEISSVYGSRYDHSDFHMGIDISDAEIANSDVVAAADGKVVDVTSEKSEQGYGVSIIIWQANRFLKETLLPKDRPSEQWVIPAQLISHSSILK